VVDIFSTAYAFAAQKVDGSVITWPVEQKGPFPFSDPLNRGGNSSSVASVLSSGCVEAIYPAEMAFAAVCDISKLPTTLQGTVNMTMSKSHALELLKDMALAKKVLGAAFAAAADLDMSRVTLGKIYLDGVLKGRRLQGLADSVVKVEYQIAGAKATPTLKMSKLVTAIESTAKAEGIQVIIKKVESSAADSETEVWQPPLPANHDDEDSSVVAIVLTVIAVCLVIFIIIGCLAYWRFSKSSA